MILSMILQSKVSTALKWGGKQNTLSFTTNLCHICCNFMKTGVLITILELCVHRGSLIWNMVYMGHSVVILKDIKQATHTTLACTIKPWTEMIKYLHIPLV